MASPLNARQTVPLAEQDRQRLRKIAADLDVSPGLLARALILSGLDRVTEPDVTTMITTERQAAHTRAAEAGRVAMQARYGQSN